MRWSGHVPHRGGAASQGRKVFTLQTLPSCNEPFDNLVGTVTGFSLHAGVAARADERKKLERLCRYIARPAVSEKRLSLTTNGNVRYDVKGITSVAGAGMRRSDPTQDAVPRWHHARHLRAVGFYRPPGRPGAQAPGQPDALGCAPSLARPLRAHCVRPNSLQVNLSRRVRPQQRASCAGDAGQARQGQQGRRVGCACRHNARRTPGSHDVQGCTNAAGAGMRKSGDLAALAHPCASRHLDVLSNGRSA